MSQTLGGSIANAHWKTCDVAGILYENCDTVSATVWRLITLPLYLHYFDAINLFLYLLTQLLFLRASEVQATLPPGRR